MISIRELDETWFVTTWIGIVRRRWLSAAVIFAIVFGFGAVLVLKSPPIYRADARVRLGEPPPTGGVTPTASGFFGLPRMSSDPFSNDLVLLESRTLTEQLIDDVGLNARIAAPRGWHRDSLFVRFATTRATDKAHYEVEWLTDGRVTVRQTAPTKAVVGTVAPGAAISFGGVQAVFRPWREGAPRTIGIQTMPFGLAVASTRSRMKTERTRREANVVDLSFDDADPGIAKLAVASVLKRFVDLRAAIQKRESDQTVDSLRVVASSTMHDLRSAETAVQDFGQDERLVAPDAQSQAYVKRYNDAISELEKTRAELGALDSVLQRVASMSKESEAWTAFLAYPRFLESVTIGGLLTRLTQLESQRTELAAHRTESNREYQVVADQIAYLDNAVRTMAVSYRSGLVDKAKVLQAQVTNIEGILGRVPGQTVELARRQRDARILSDVLVLTEQRLRQEELRQALMFSNVQIIDPPELRFKPVWPRKRIGIMVAFLLASLSALMGMVVAERVDAMRPRARPSAAAIVAWQRELTGIPE